jgi:hypothetical protein
VPSAQRGSGCAQARDCQKPRRRAALPICGAKNFVSLRLYSAPQLHRTIVAILGICASGSRDQETSRMDLPALRTRFRGGRCPGRHRGRNAPAVSPGVMAGRLKVLLTVWSHLPGPPQHGCLALPMMPKTKKREVRRMIRQQSAWITLNGVATTECQIMDISKRGAKIIPGGSSVVPARFELALIQGDQKRKVCEVIWRRGRMLGLKFIG